MSSSGKSPATSLGGKYTLDAEVAFLGPVFDAAGDAFHLVGHSFGGAVALKAALRHRGRVRSLTLFEPIPFALLVSTVPGCPATREILGHAERTSRFAALGDYEAAAEEFIDYWFERGAWAAMREEVRANVRARMGLLRERWDALFCDPIVLSDVASIDIPILYLTAKKSNLPTRALSELLIEALPRVRTMDIEGVGHMAPLSHPDRVNPVIEAFLREVSTS